MSQIPDDLAAAVRRAATATVVPPVNPGGIRHRWHRRRRRRIMTATAGAATLLVAVGIATVSATLGGNGRPAQLAEPGPPPAAPAGAAPAQRLLVGGTGVAVSVTDPSGPADPAPRVAELLPGSSITHHRLPEFDVWYRIVAPPDGRLVGLAHDDSRPGTPPDVDSPPAGPAVRLVVLSPTGAVEVDRGVTVPGEPVRLVAATAEAAYLWRPTGLVEHDLASGAERTVLPATSLGDPPDRLPAGAMDVLAGRLVVAGTEKDPCRLRVADLSSAAVAEFSPISRGCASLGMVRISPDGTRAAISYQRAVARGETAGRTRIMIVNLGSGAVEADAATDRSSGPDATFVPKQPAGMAWRDEVSVRAAVIERADLTGVYQPGDIREEIVRAQSGTRR